MANAAANSRVSFEALEEFCFRVFTSLGVCDADARITTDALVTTDAWGVHTHGTKLLTGYARRLRSGGLRTDATPTIVGEGPAWALVDGHSVLGQVASAFATRVAIQKSAQLGRRFCHRSQELPLCRCRLLRLARSREGMIGLAMANDVPSVAAPGSKGPVLGSNPIAYAIPGGENDPILLEYVHCDRRRRQGVCSS